MVKRWLPTAVDDYEAWLAETWRQSVDRFDVVPVGEPTPAGSLRSVGGVVHYRGEPVWLRVAPFLAHKMDWEWLTGLRDAMPLKGIKKPDVLASTEWTRTDPVPVPIVADLVTLVTDPTAAGRNQFLTEPVDLSDVWLADLRASLDALAGYPTTRETFGHQLDRFDHLVRAVYGRPLPADVAPQWGTVEHQDLHWGNITIPKFMILDWEMWGVGLTGYGVARLYCTGLAVPEVAEKLYAAFADILDSPSGRYAQLVAAAEVIMTIADYDHPPELARGVHRVTDTILSKP